MTLTHKWNSRLFCFYLYNFEGIHHSINVRWNNISIFYNFKRLWKGNFCVNVSWILHYFLNPPLGFEGNINQGPGVDDICFWKNLSRKERKDGISRFVAFYFAFETPWCLLWLANLWEVRVGDREHRQRFLVLPRLAKAAIPAILSDGGIQSESRRQEAPDCQSILSNIFVSSSLLAAIRKHWTKQMFFLWWGKK